MRLTPLELGAAGLAVITGAGLLAWWRLRRAAGHRTKLDRTLDAWEASNAEACDAALQALLRREDGPRNLAWGPVYSCPYCDGGLQREPFNFYCPRCHASVSNPQVAMEATDD